MSRLVEGDAHDGEIALAAKLPGAPRARRVLANGLSHHVLEWNAAGGGPDVLVCHGFLDVAASFARMATALSTHGAHVVAFDWRGHGKTDWIGAGGYYHFPDYALDLAELTAALELDGYHLVGHSMGGTAATLFASARPPGLRSLVSIEGLGPPESSDGVERRLTEWITGVARARERPPRPLRGEDEAVLKLRAQHQGLDEALARELVPFMTQVQGDGTLRFAFDPLHKTRSPTPFHKAHYVAALRAIAVPTLIVSGSDGFRTADHDERKGAIPDVREETVGGVGHMIHWHAPGALAALVHAHLEANR